MANIFKFGEVSQKELIKKIRECKTAAQERDVIAKQSAAIRTSIKENVPRNRALNVSKLIFLHLQGHSTYFGHMECLKVASSAKFNEKLLGYLAVSLMVEQSSPVCTLLTNCLKNDLGSANVNVLNVALDAFTSIGTRLMVQDVAAEIKKALNHPQTIIRKKALCAVARIVAIAPEDFELFFDVQDAKFAALFNEKDHGMLLCAAGIVRLLLRVLPESRRQLRRLAPAVIRTLKAAVQDTYSTEHDCGGVPDPFLQCSLIEVLRQLLVGCTDSGVTDAAKAEDDAELLCESVSDCLAYVASILDDTRPATNAVLYEIVKTILVFPAPEHSMVVLAVNILGRFIAAASSNLRYVALDLLAKFVRIDPQSTQKHQSIIMECLEDDDPSIKRVALQLLFEIINEQNYQPLVSELISYYESFSTAGSYAFQRDHTLYMFKRLMEALQRFAHCDYAFYCVSCFNILKAVVVNEIEEAAVTAIISHIQRSSTEDLVVFVNDLFLKYFCEEAATNFRNENVPLLMICLFLTGNYFGHVHEKAAVANMLFSKCTFRCPTLVLYHLNCVFAVSGCGAVPHAKAFAEFLQPYVSHEDFAVNRQANFYQTLVKQNAFDARDVEYFLKGRLRDSPDESFVSLRDACLVHQSELFWLFSSWSHANAEEECSASIVVFKACYDSVLSDFAIQIAPPKAVQLALEAPAPKKLVLYGDRMVQRYKISLGPSTNPPLKLKINYKINVENRMEPKELIAVIRMKGDTAQ